MKNPARVRPGYEHLETLSTEAWQQTVHHFRATLEETPIRALLAAAVGGERVLEAFSDLRGVGIGAFAAMVELPVSTVRHYVELGLVQPYLVSGKFRFAASNISEVRSVTQWAALGLSLGAIAERKRQMGALPFSVSQLDGQEVFVQTVLDRAAVSGNLEPTASAGLLSEEETNELFQRLPFNPRLQASIHLEDLNAQIARLESQQKDIAAKLEAARGLKGQIELTWKLGQSSNNPA